ncbi:MAG: trigger factor [Candidatus Gracilibacteria bacterium]|jgi:trigger factor
MEYKIKNLEKSSVEIEITIPDEKMAEYKQKAAENISKEVKIKGFRQGHVPLDVLKQNIDEKYIEEESFEVAVKMAYAEVVVKENIQVITHPKIDIMKKEPFTFKATVAILPKVELKDYKSIKIKPKDSKVTDEEIDDVFKDFQKYSTTYTKKDGKAEKGDRVEIDFEGFDEDGKEMTNTASKNHPVIIGEKTLIEGFEENLIGMAEGEEKEFSLTFPKDYGKKEFQGKKAKFKVKVNVVESPITPDITEDFIEKMTGKRQTVEELKSQIKENIKVNKETKQRQEMEEEYIEELIKRADLELPEDLIHQEAHHILEEIAEDISQKGVKFDQFLKDAKTSEEELVKKYHTEAERRLKMRFAISELIKQEKIEITDDEAKAEFEKVKSFYPKKEHYKIEKDFKNGELKDQIKSRLILRKLFDRVLA